MKRRLRIAVPNSRRGTIVIIAMIALLLASAMGLALIKTSLAERKLVLRSQHRLQAQWLTEAGIERAVVQYRQNPGFDKETWTVPAALLPQGETCSIAITLQAASLNNDTDLVRLTVVTDYQTEDLQRIRDRKSVDIPAIATAD